MSAKVIGEYALVFEPKVRRAYDKELGAGPKATDEQVLAFYDKFGGLILKKGEKVETGIIWKAYQAKKIAEAKKVTEKVEKVEEVKEVKKEFKAKK